MPWEVSPSPGSNWRWQRSEGRKRGETDETRKVDTPESGGERVRWSDETFHDLKSQSVSDEQWEETALKERSSLGRAVLFCSTQHLNLRMSTQSTRPCAGNRLRCIRVTFPSSHRRSMPPDSGVSVPIFEGK